MVTLDFEYVLKSFINDTSFSRGFYEGVGVDIPFCYALILLISKLAIPVVNSVSSTLLLQKMFKDGYLFFNQNFFYYR